MKKYNYLIFDLDNTLLDFSLSETYALKKIFTKYGVIYNDETVARYKEINHGLWKKLEEGTIKKETLLNTRFKLFFETQGVAVDGAQADDTYRRFLEERADSIEDAHIVLQTLKDQGYIILAGTNGIGRTQRARLENNLMMNYFTELFISEEVGFEKPDVRFFDYIFNQMGITDLSSVVMIGDSLSSDILGANRSGIDAIWFNPGYNYNEMTNLSCSEINKLKELLDAV
ncbi:noncanonical pyrimidine nucleotidase, YjjG family [Vagococcus penaei]|uniref:Noncanonical pyrimidine nucleotidase, YjjG family n=1 Tax=Vagococcus penaei TaxID=633807 RepID=A0A1Q2D556_9ENTE|nr:YjjG family noncanonical pyrimidine nucleotidase [Vagococcus penaei]AQP53536.1 noncanonical pyrimidine nucleotidase, YjjG family [Vagococcus penaei]RSU07479.1 noncanonical pyrimidine nucleotidase, YjjG family [Vagococcus penaei]